MEERSGKRRNGMMSILMLPWLAHGHISPFLELSKRLSDRNITIYFCSTPVNLSPIKRRLARTKYSSRIHLVELHLPHLPDLPPHLHTTKHLPPCLMPTLKTAFDLSAPGFSITLGLLHPDLVVYDFLQPWAPVVALSQGIPVVEFFCTGAAMSAFSIWFLMNLGVESPFPELHLQDHELPGFVQLFERTANGIKDGDRWKRCTGRSVGVVLIKSFQEIETKYIDYLTIQMGKKFVPVGPLVEEDHQHDQEDDGKRVEMTEWLDSKGKNSTVFVSFGSEYFLSRREITEIAHGLEQSRVNFIWVIRFHGGGREGDLQRTGPLMDSLQLQDALPEGFLGRVRDRGCVIEGWAPQAEILRHPSTGRFLSHCGWSSVMEAMRFGVPIIAMPMHLDQPINARLVGEGVGVGLEVKRDEEGRFRREDVAGAVRSVMVERAGERVRKRAMELRDVMELRRERGKEDEEIDGAVEELLHVCGKTNLVKDQEINHRFLVPN
ncbi:UDP-glucosyltransferase 29-like [Punica granatum]|uniref:Glycosyltransferase N-terminal domain-containing protein n=2 Tax=Punica granatum TaxID=22663 RepID=A0A218XSY3_PUNGR|nr:UDP-glucosyltransferase 29-like [Punica granatum]OWM87641.1 hypothetical protein CDL15_Pgr022754 [Punica granatum]PKI63697.1 hypothetical protein CRG98_015887 [Punica granatum]